MHFFFFRISINYAGICSWTSLKREVFNYKRPDIAISRNVGVFLTFRFFFLSFSGLHSEIELIWFTLCRVCSRSTDGSCVASRSLNGRSVSGIWNIGRASLRCVIVYVLWGDVCVWKPWRIHHICEVFVLEKLKKKKNISKL